MRAWILLSMVLFVVCAGKGVRADEVPNSAATEECLGCHAELHPGLVEGWKKSRHAGTTPGQAAAVEGPARKVTGQEIPETLKGVTVGCAECHGLRPDAHQDTFEHNGVKIHVVVSPKDCAACHTQESEQYDRNLMAHAYGNLVDNPVYRMLMQAINNTPVPAKGKGASEPANDLTDADSCLYCHGTKLEVKGTVTRDTEMGEMTFPVISAWPNQGTGRINLDGSKGSCSACHSRHEFSIEMARKPYTCKECHVGPDVPAYKVYEGSKHGNIFSSSQSTWNFEEVPWTIGKDFTAPTCAACHISLLVDPEGKMVVQRSHEVKNRLPWRIFGLIYAHPHPREADLASVRNRAGLPLPTDFDGSFAAKYLWNDQERSEATSRMQAACLACHHRSWVDGFWDRLHNSIETTNRTVLAATQVLGEIWKRDLATSHEKKGNPFDEYIERVWCNGWLFYANSVRFSTAMGGGGDYGVFADGRYHLMKTLREMEDWLELRKGRKK